MRVESVTVGPLLIGSRQPATRRDRPRRAIGLHRHATSPGTSSGSLESPATQPSAEAGRACEERGREGLTSQVSTHRRSRVSTHRRDEDLSRRGNRVGARSRGDSEGDRRADFTLALQRSCFQTVPSEARIHSGGRSSTSNPFDQADSTLNVQRSTFNVQIFKSARWSFFNARVSVTLRSIQRTEVRPPDRSRVTITVGGSAFSHVHGVQRPERSSTGRAT